MATLEDVLVPIYMYHRYQVEAASKLIGGEDYMFSLAEKEIEIQRLLHQKNNGEPWQPFSTH